MKILVIGGSGLIGSHILDCSKTRHEVVGTYRKFAQPGLLFFDAGDTAAARQLILREKPEAVVHAAGWTWVDGCEDDPKRAFAENAEQPRYIAELCHSEGIHFTYFSTSYIFDGTVGLYNEDAIPNPINVYAKSKWEGEQGVSAASSEALIPRVICVYGAEAQKKNFAYQVWNAMKEGKCMTLPSDQCGNPTYAGDIARWVIELIENRTSGTRHLAGPWPDCTRLEWAEKLVTAFANAGVQSSHGFELKTLPTVELKQKALRPLKAGMVSNFKLSAPTDFDETVRAVVRSQAG